jgi:hypothetical protein
MLGLARLDDASTDIVLSAYREAGIRVQQTAPLFDHLVGDGEQA